MSGGRTADISLVGYYGILNPDVLWILNHRPDLLSRSPAELRNVIAASRPPECGVEVDRLRADGRVMHTEICHNRMQFRYVNGRPAWVCFAHTTYDANDAGAPSRDVPIDMARFKAPPEIENRHVDVPIDMARFKAPPEIENRHVVYIRTRKAKMEKLPDFDLWEELGHALEGRQRELFWDEGEWKLRDA